MIVFEESALNSAFEQSLNHAPPFSEEECADFDRPLHIQHARNIEELHRVPNLTHIEIVGSEIDADDLVKLKNLTVCKIYATKISNAHNLSQLDSVEHLEVNFCNVQDANFVFSLPQLKMAWLIGNPWHEEAYRTLQQQIQKQVESPHGLLIIISPQKDWEHTIKLQEYDLPLIVGRIIRKELILRPGVPTYTSGNCDFLTLEERGIGSLLYGLFKNPEWTLENIFKPASSKSERYLDFQSRPEVSYAAESATLVNSSNLPEEDKRLLKQFLDNFPSLNFHRETDYTIQHFATQNIDLPAWYTQILQTLHFVLLQQDDVYVQFGNTESMFFDDERWFFLWAPNLGVRDGERDVEDEQGNTAGSLEIAEDIHGEYTLTISQNPDDKRVYIYEIEEEDDDEVYVAFESYAHMFASISMIEIRLGEDFLRVKAAR